MNETTATEKALERNEGDGGPVFAPATDVYETNDAVVVLSDMPGVESSQVAVELENNVLTISGNVTPANPAGFESILHEYAEGSYKRVFTLGQHIDREKIQAEIKNGCLKVVLPKVREAKPSKITVQAG